MMTTLNVWTRGLAMFVICAMASVVSQAQTFTTIANFPPDGGPWYVSLVQGPDGGLYGTTISQGKGGTVFRLGMDGALTTLYTFCSVQNCLDGSAPYSGVIVGTDGNFYGMTYGGGAHGAGTVFELTLEGSLTTIYNFCSQPSCADGSFPFAALVAGVDGNFYGTTSGGGIYNDGSVFKLTHSGVLTTLHSFCAGGYPCSDGFSPEAALIQGTDGNFFGSTYRGGKTADVGTLFKVSSSGVFTTLWDFSQHCCGVNPLAPLIELADGKFYGTTSTSCTFCDYGGNIFSVTASGDLTVLYTFCMQQNCPDGNGLRGSLVLGTDGNLYGTTTLGGLGGNNCASGCGTIFQASKGKFNTIYSFCLQSGCPDGFYPQGGLTQATNGVFYGTTNEGGMNVFGGTAFSLDMSLAPFVTFVRSAGKVGQTGGILGQGFTGTTNVSLNGIPARFTVLSDTFIRATVPAGATTGYVSVVTPSGTLSSNVPFHVLP